MAAAKKEKLRLQAENEHVEEREAAERALEAERRREAGRRQADHEFVAESLHRHYGVVIPSGGQPVGDMQWVNESLHRHALQQRSPPAPLALLAPDEAEVEDPVKSTEEDTGADEGGGYPEQVQSRLKVQEAVCDDECCQAWRTELVREFKDLSQPNSPAPVRSSALSKLLASTPEGGAVVCATHVLQDKEMSCLGCSLLTVRVVR